MSDDHKSGEVMTRPLTARDIEVLADLRSANDYAKGLGQHDGFVRPMDVGGKDSSYHSNTLAKLVHRGFAKRRHYGSNRSYLYRIRKKGRKLLDRIKEERHGERTADRPGREASDQ